MVWYNDFYPHLPYVYENWLTFVEVFLSFVSNIDTEEPRKSLIS